MMDFKEYYRCDRARYSSGGGTRYIYLLLYFYRKTQACNSPFKRKILRKIYTFISTRHGIEIDPCVRIGKGLGIGHPYGITITPKAVLGENINIQKGVTIGQENRGKRKGAPVLGNNIWLGVNCSVIGHITIGNDVLIAPNTYVNCDVPDHSVVFGNPCVIKHSESATSEYVINTV